MLAGTISDVEGRPINDVPVVCSLLVDNRAVPIQDLSTDRNGRYRIDRLPKGTDVVIEVVGQQSKDRGYTMFSPVEPTIDATNQLGVLNLRQVSNDRNDLHWIAKHYPPSDHVVRQIEEIASATREGNQMLMQQVQANQSAWSHLRLSNSNAIPSSELFDNLLETARSDDKPENAIAAIRFLMEIGGKGADLQLSKVILNWFSRTPLPY